MPRIAAVVLLILAGTTAVFATTVQRSRYIAKGGESSVTLKLDKPVQPETVVAVFNLMATASDRQHPGKLEGMFFSGTIDYASGKLELDFPSPLKANDRIEVRYEKGQ